MPKLVPILAGLAAAGLASLAQNAPTAPATPPKAEKPAKAEKPGGAREKAIREFLQSLPPEKRQQALAALKKVWEDEDVRAARRQLAEASENYKQTVRHAVEESDPEVRQLVGPLVDRLVKEGLSPASLAPKKAGEGPLRYLRLLGLTAEKLDSLTPEEKTAVSSLKDRLMAEPRVKEALAKVEGTPAGAGKVPALRDLRQTVRKVALELEPKLGPVLDRASEPMP